MSSSPVAQPQDHRPPRRGPYLPLAKRLRLYEEVLQLRRKGLSYSKIIERIHGLSGVRLRTSHIYNWTRRKYHPLGSVIGNLSKFEAKPSPILAYVIGVRVTDADLYTNEKYRQFVIRLRVIDHEFAEEMGRSLANLLGREKPYKPRWDRSSARWCVTTSSVMLYQFLHQPFDKLSSYIEHCMDCVSAFLRAVFDGEGCIHESKLKIYNTNSELLLYIKRLLQDYFGIQATGPHKHKEAGAVFISPTNGKIYHTKKECRYLYVRLRSLPRFYDKIGFTIRRKQQRLTEAIQAQHFLFSTRYNQSATVSAVRDS